MIRAVILFILIGVIGCHQETPMHLVDDFYSYQSQEDITHRLGKGVVFRGKREGYSTGAIDYRHLSQNGKLAFLFFENRLAGVGFYPQDTTAYLEAIEKEFGKIGAGDSIRYQGVTIRKGYDHQMGSIGGLYISWVDPILLYRYEGRKW